MLDKRPCPHCGSKDWIIFFANIPWWTRGHCTQCTWNFPVTEAEIEQELERRNLEHVDEN